MAFRVFSLTVLAGLVSAATQGQVEAAPVAAIGRCAAGAPALAGEVAVELPERIGAKTRLDLVMTLPAPATGADRLYLVDGELSRGGRRIDGFLVEQRAADGEGPVAVRVVRTLPAGHYELVLAVTELASGRCFGVERTLDVPGLAGAEESEAALVRLFVPTDRLLMNRVRFDAEVRDAGVAAVAFELDGRRVMTRSRPPWSVELDLGASPRLHRLKAIALDAAGAELARDEALVNAGPHRFAVRLALAPGAAGTLEARAVVEVPEGERVDRLELELNDRLVAVLRQPPWIAVLPAPPGGAPAWVRAAAFLSEGGSAEAVRVAGAGLGAAAFGETDVDFVELFTTVVDRKGRPLEDLGVDDIVVREDGRPQQVRRFERVADVPVHVALLLDTSISMAEELDTLEREALRFFRQVLTPKDRAAVIPFADEPHLAVRFTGNLERLAGGLAELSAEGGTALHDALAFALHYFSGLGGKRALVLLSDGEDSGSKIPFEDVLDFARRSGVAIYSIGLGVTAKSPQPGSVLDRLARETGGLSFRADRTARLARIYDQIETELRQQYLIGYQSDAAGGDAFRRVEVEVRRPGVEVRTAPGYYP